MVDFMLFERSCEILQKSRVCTLQFTWLEQKKYILYFNKIGRTMRSVTWNPFPIKNLRLIPCFHLWSEVTWIQICASLSHRKKMKAETSRLIPRKPIENLELLLVWHGSITKYSAQFSSPAAFHTEIALSQCVQLLYKLEGNNLILV